MRCCNSFHTQTYSNGNIRPNQHNNRLNCFHHQRKVHSSTSLSSSSRVLRLCKIPRVVTGKPVDCAKSDVKPSRHKTVISHHQLNGYNFGNVSRHKHVKTILKKMRWAGCCTKLWKDGMGMIGNLRAGYAKSTFSAKKKTAFEWTLNIDNTENPPAMIPIWCNSTIFGEKRVSFFSTNLIAAVSRLKSH